MPKYNGYMQFDIEEIRALTPESAPHYRHLLYVTMNGGEAVTSLCPLFNYELELKWFLEDLDIEFEDIGFLPYDELYRMRTE